MSINQKPIPPMSLAVIRGRYRNTLPETVQPEQPVTVPERSFSQPGSGDENAKIRIADWRERQRRRGAK